MRRIPLASQIFVYGLAASGIKRAHFLHFKGWQLRVWEDQEARHTSPSDLQSLEIALFCRGSPNSCLCSYCKPKNLEITVMFFFFYQQAKGVEALRKSD